MNRSACRDHLLRLERIPVLSQTGQSLVVSLHTIVAAEIQNSLYSRIVGPMDQGKTSRTQTSQIGAVWLKTSIAGSTSRVVSCRLADHRTGNNASDHRCRHVLPRLWLTDARSDIKSGLHYLPILDRLRQVSWIRIVRPRATSLLYCFGRA